MNITMMIMMKGGGRWLAGGLGLFGPVHCGGRKGKLLSAGTIRAEADRTVSVGALHWCGVCMAKQARGQEEGAKRCSLILPMFFLLAGLGPNATLHPPPHRQAAAAAGERAGAGAGADRAACIASTPLANPI
jgi:hypothetical protein